MSVIIVVEEGDVVPVVYVSSIPTAKSVKSSTTTLSELLVVPSTVSVVSK